MTYIYVIWKFAKYDSKLLGVFSTLEIAKQKLSEIVETTKRTELAKNYVQGRPLEQDDWPEFQVESVPLNEWITKFNISVEAHWDGGDMPVGSY